MPSSVTIYTKNQRFLIGDYFSRVPHYPLLDKGAMILENQRPEINNPEEKVTLEELLEKCTPENRHEELIPDRQGEERI